MTTELDLAKVQNSIGQLQDLLRNEPLKSRSIALTAIDLCISLSFEIERLRDAIADAYNASTYAGCLNILKEVMR